jgi:3-isopropylmalate dehydratase small subunit
MGQVYLASPAVATASAVAGVITLPGSIPAKPVLFEAPAVQKKAAPKATVKAGPRPTTFRGRAWVIRKDNIDTDMIYHNRHLAVTDLAEMGQYCFGNLKGWEDFAKKAKPGDIVIVGKNFGAGSSRQQAVDCFKSLGVSLIIAESFGAIYERNAINTGFPIMISDLAPREIKDGDEIEVDIKSGKIRLPGGKEIAAEPFSDAQLSLFMKGGLLKG